MAARNSGPAPDTAVDRAYRASFDGRWRIARAATRIDDPRSKAEREALLAQRVAELSERQRVLRADHRYALLLVFQAMDAAGKDSTIRAVLTGVDPAGCSVHAFKPPSVEERDHDFLWRSVARLPARGQIGVFNRSYYEEVLVAKLEPSLLRAQNLPDPTPDAAFWKQRYRSIRDHERHLADSGTVVLKFFLHVSREEQRQRLLDRLDQPEKNWKFEAGDLGARDRWDDYQRVYEEAINATSRPWAPWYVIPADSKSTMRLIVADIIVRRLRALDLRYPQLDDAALNQLSALRHRLAD